MFVRTALNIFEKFDHPISSNFHTPATDMDVESGDLCCGPIGLGIIYNEAGCIGGSAYFAQSMINRRNIVRGHDDVVYIYRHWPDCVVDASDRRAESRMVKHDRR
ncbi:hypothetical protein CD928_16305 [Sphingopyxis sp. GW247-27LB]|nr:hypothetical protein CD928_16305 [Sphingopyxis sp. GW247-27LB]